MAGVLLLGNVICGAYVGEHLVQEFRERKERERRPARRTVTLRRRAPPPPAEAIYARTEWHMGAPMDPDFPTEIQLIRAHLRLLPPKHKGGAGTCEPAREAVHVVMIPGPHHLHHAAVTMFSALYNSKRESALRFTFVTENLRRRSRCAGTSRSTRPCTRG